MHATISSILSFATAVSAVGNSIVINNSFETIYLWSTGDRISQEFTVAPGTSWSEQLHRGQNVIGQAIKITKVKNGLFTAAPTQILGYTLDSRLWFSLDATFGEPFAGQKLTVSSVGSTGNIQWPTGKDIGDEVRTGNPNSDLVLTIDPQAGAGSPPARASAVPVAPNPAPVNAAPAPANPTPAPAQPSANPSAPTEGDDAEEEGDDDDEEDDGADEAEDDDDA